MSEDDGWRPLPPRARSLFLVTHGLGWAVPALVVTSASPSESARRHAMRRSASTRHVVSVPAMSTPATVPFCSKTGE